MVFFKTCDMGYLILCVAAIGLWRFSIFMNWLKNQHCGFARIVFTSYKTHFFVRNTDLVTIIDLNGNVRTCFEPILFQVLSHINWTFYPTRISCTLPNKINEQSYAMFHWQGEGCVSKPELMLNVKYRLCVVLLQHNISEVKPLAFPSKSIFLANSAKFRQMVVGSTHEW